MNVRPNLEEFANLPQPEWEVLWRGVEILNAQSREADFPPQLHANTFRLMQKIGAKVRSYESMRLVASSLHYNRLACERLRTY